MSEQTAPINPVASIERVLSLMFEQHELGLPVKWVVLGEYVNPADCRKAFFYVHSADTSRSDIWGLAEAARQVL